MREALAIEIDTSQPAERVIRALEQLKEWRGLPKAIRCDNGPEYTAQCLVNWCCCATSSQASRTKTPTLNDSTKPIAPKWWTRTCSRTLSKCVTSPTSGCKATTKNARTSRLETCHRASFANNANGLILLDNRLLYGEGYEYGACISM